jgi:hypothetical protein
MMNDEKEVKMKFGSYAGKDARDESGGVSSSSRATQRRERGVSQCRVRSGSEPRRLSAVREEVG